MIPFSCPTSFCLNSQVPIMSPISIRLTSPDEFARLDYEVMHHAFASQNELGRLCDEVIYQHDLATRLQKAGLGPVQTEVPVTVAHRDFSKTYLLDLVVGDAAIYELKTASNLVVEHDAQLLHYLFLENAARGKLVNFRPAQVESRYVNSALSKSERYRVECDDRRWVEHDEASRFLRARLIELIADWGAFLELPLYADALTHFLGGEENVLRMIPLTRDGASLGRQRLHLLTPDMGYRLTALANRADQYEPHLRSLLLHSPLRAIQWINLAGHSIQFVTLQK
jgi:GxxExxY protein